MSSKTNDLTKIGHNGKLYIIKVVSNEDGSKYQLVEFAQFKDAVPLDEITTNFKIEDLSHEEKQKVIQTIIEEFKITYDPLHTLRINADPQKMASST